MKWFIYSLLFCLSFLEGASAQTTSPSATKKLYSEKEKAQIKKTFYSNIKTLQLTPEVEEKYLALLNSYSQRMNEANRNKDLSNEQYERAISALVREQNSKVKRILTYEQYKKHLILYNPIENSVKYRINKRE